MKGKKTGLIIIFFLILCFIGISMWSVKPVEEVLSDAVEVAEKQFKDHSGEINTELAHFSIFLPEGFNVEEQSAHNLILTKEEQTYILFYNELESEASRLNYNAVSDENKNSKWLESFEDNERFGYIYITELEEQFEVQLGVGGVKVTTISSQERLLEDVNDMMEMANSLAY